MHEITLIKLNGGNYIDSRDVAALINKEHNHLLRDIRNYIKVIDEKGASKNGHSDFFIESSYQSAQNKEMPCFLISKMGAEMIGNKVTGEKGILFTAVYVAKFNELEALERAETKQADTEQIKAVIHTPRLGEYNAASRLIVFAMRNEGATAEHIMDFLRGVYEPLGFSITSVINSDAPRMYTAHQIAEKFGVYSLNGNPHNQAVSSILSGLALDESHKTIVPSSFGNQVRINTYYDDFSVFAVKQWLNDNKWPGTIQGQNCVYRVLYAHQPSDKDTNK